MNKATGERKKHSLLMKKVVITNNKQLTIVNINALLGFIIPAGISRTAVLGFIASYLASSQRLNAMAAERAKIMQRITRMKYSVMAMYGLYCNNELLMPFKGRESLHPIARFRFHWPFKVGCFNNPKKNPTSAKGIAKMLCENFTRERYFLSSVIKRKDTIPCTIKKNTVKTTRLYKEITHKSDNNI